MADTTTTNGEWSCIFTMDAMLRMAPAFLSEAPPNLKTFICVELNRLRSNFTPENNPKDQVKILSLKAWKDPA